MTDSGESLGREAASEGLRWQVTKAVRASNLPSPSRLIMLVLSDVADTGTAEIPERFTPSLAVLAQETGLNKSTVKRHLSLLEEAGWIVRSRPTLKQQREGERTRYRLSVPGRTQRLGAHSAQGGRRTGSSGVGAEEARGRRTVRHQETDLSDQEQTTTKTSRATRSTRRDAPPTRVDVEQICRHLADRIEANGSKRPEITQTWRDAARRLLDKDGRTVDQVVKAIDWCQGDDFWRANVLSMPKLREKYDQLRLQAQRARASPRVNGHTPYRDPVDASAYLGDL